jgi:hypothetical protein
MVLAIAALALFITQRNLYPFLAVMNQASGEFLVVEGWVPGYGLRQAVTVFKEGGYRGILTSGCVVSDEWGDRTELTYADVGADKLRKLGLKADVVTPVPCRSWRQDRTYNSALAVKTWFEKNGVAVRAIDVVTVGPHARRSRLLFQKALGNRIKVGIIPVKSNEYDPSRWWESSDGFREVIGEEIAYLYARLLFWPSKE